MLDGVLDMIGTAALLEQLAEESAELAQAALKLARKMRNENPTPKSRASALTSTVMRWTPASITQERCPVSL